MSVGLMVGYNLWTVGEGVDTMNIILSVGTFVLGFFAEKVLELLFKVVQNNLNQRKKEQILQNFYTVHHPDIFITASGVPCYYPRQIKEDLSDSKMFVLGRPIGVDGEEVDVISVNDVVTRDFQEYIEKNALQESLEKARRDVFELFSNRSQGNYFNGTLFGVTGLNGFVRSSDTKEEPVLHIDFYKTDYYTHKVMEHLWQAKPFNNNMLNIPTDCFNWFRTSFGVSVILIIPKQNEIILTKRSAHASYSDGKEWVYVSVTETLSETDYNDETDYPDLKKCVLRGINEELGITERELKVDTLRFYDTFYETHFYQDNIVASIELSDELTFSDIYSLLAKDKFMEISDILTISNDKKSIAKFIETNKSTMRAQTIFSLESFSARL